MHPDAYSWVRDRRPRTPVRVVVEFGARDANGTVRDLFPGVDYIGVDLSAGRAVDVVADAADYQPPTPPDVVVSTELLEHTPRWCEIVANAARILRPGGTFIVTAAGPGRGPHGQHGAIHPAPGEWYENITPAELAHVLTQHFAAFTVDRLGFDVRAVAHKE